MIVKLLTEHHLEFLSLKGDCRGSSKSTLVKSPHCWKSHALAHMDLNPHHKKTYLCGFQQVRLKPVYSALQQKKKLKK